MITYDIQVFDTTKKEWITLGYEKEDLPMSELRQEARNIALVEDDPIRIVKLIRAIETDEDGEIIGISDPVAKQVGKKIN